MCFHTSIQPFSLQIYFLFIHSAAALHWVLKFSLLFSMSLKSDIKKWHKKNLFRVTVFQDSLWKYNLYSFFINLHLFCWLFVWMGPPWFNAFAISMRFLWSNRLSSTKMTVIPTIGALEGNSIIGKGYIPYNILLVQIGMTRHLCAVVYVYICKSINCKLNEFFSPVQGAR